MCQGREELVLTVSSTATRGTRGCPHPTRSSVVSHKLSVVSILYWCVILTSFVFIYIQMCRVVLVILWSVAWIVIFA